VRDSISTRSDMNSKNPLDDKAVAAITSHMNQDHSDALVLYLRVYGKINTSSIADVRMTNIDETGLDISYSSAGEVNKVRINYVECGFDSTVDCRQAARAMLVQMVNEAER